MLDLVVFEHGNMFILVDHCYDFVTTNLCYVSGLSCRELLQKFQHKLIILFKLMMLERRVSKV